MTEPASPQIPGADRRSLELPSVTVGRGVAALAVLAYHTYQHASAVHFDSFSGNADRMLRTASLGDLLLYGAFGFGFLGVNFFFIISGFCIHLPYAANRRPLWLREFAARRFWRIYPPYLAVTLGLFVMFGPLLGRYDANGVNLTNLLGHLFFWHYWGPASNAGMGISPVMWTIAIEAEFYLLYVVLFLVIRKYGCLRVTLWLLAVDVLYRVAWSTWLDGHDLPLVFSPSRCSPTRFGEWMLGALLAEEYARGSLDTAAGPVRMLPAAGACVVLLGASVIAGGLLGIDKYATMDVTSSVALFILLRSWVWSDSRARGASVFARPGMAVLRWAGSRCYSMYLVHLAVISIVFTVARDHFGVKAGPGAGMLATILLAEIGVLLAAELLHRLVEAPSHALARKIATKSRPS